MASPGHENSSVSFALRFGLVSPRFQAKPFDDLATKAFQGSAHKHNARRGAGTSLDFQSLRLWNIVPDLQGKSANAGSFSKMPAQSICSERGEDDQIVERRSR